MNNNRTRRNRQTLASRFFRKANNSNSSNNNSNIPNRFEFLPANGYVKRGSRNLTFKNVRQVRTIPQEGKSISANVFRPTVQSRTRRHIGKLRNHPAPLPMRVTSAIASKLLANAHEASNTYKEMAVYINTANISPYFPEDTSQANILRHTPEIRQKAKTKLQQFYKNVA